MTAAIEPDDDSPPRAPVTYFESALGLSQGPALYCLIWAVPTLLAYRQLERHLLPDGQG